VLDMSDRIAGAYCAKLLVDAGADVIKLEPPAGTSLRHDGAVPTGGAQGCLFSYLCAGTRSVVAGPDDRETLAALVSWSDVVVLSAGRREAEAAGRDPRALAALHPGVLVVTITDFGWDGPWEERAATEFTLQAWCGATGFRGFPEGPPVSVGGRVGEYVGGVYAAVGILAAARGGWPSAGAGGVRHVDLSLLECMTQSMQGYEWLHASLMGLSGFSRSVEVPSIEPAKDGWVGFSMVTGQQWRDFATMVGQPALVDDPELCLQLGRWPRRAEVYALVHPWLATRTVDEVVQHASLFRVPAAAIGTGATIVDMDHFAARRVFVANPAGFHQPRPPWQMSRCAPAPLRPAPALGEHQDAVPRGFRARRAAVAEPVVEEPVEGPLPLSGVRVIDFTAFWAGPSATFILAALGADVVKIESVQRPDGMRFAGGTLAGTQKWWEHSWIFHGVNAGKRSVTLDLGHPDGQRIVRTLIARADVVVENFSPRVIEQFDLGWDVVRRLNPRLVMVRMPAFGLDGPWRDRVGFAPTMEQLSGMAWRTGLPDGPPMSPRGACDPIAGAHAAFALLAALAHRERTGDGQLVEVPMIEVALNLTAEQVMVFERHGELLARQGNRGAGAPQNVYRCAGDDAWIALAVERDDQWGSLVRALGAPAWTEDAALATAAGRQGAADMLDARLAEWFSAREVGEAVEVLAPAGVPVAEVVPSPLVRRNPQLEARGFFERLEHPEAGAQDYAGLPLRPAPDAGWCRRPPPTLGQHNDEVLGDEAGLSSQERAELRRAQVIGDRPRGL
jgi:crotonobetainyl-CoA:carnitine CoA-transferase CaiB-like acyl-CoA transferase